MRKTDSSTGVSLVTHKDAEFSVLREKEGAFFEMAQSIPSISAFRAYKTKTTLSGKQYTAPVSDRCRVEIPQFWIKNRAAVAVDDGQGNLTEIDAALSEQDGKSYLTFDGGVNREFVVVYKKSVRAGDVNFDGRVSAVDALLALQTAVGSRRLSIYQPDAADLDGDGEITANDAFSILLSTVGKAAE